jgi:hypothetical protein
MTQAPTTASPCPRSLFLRKQSKNTVASTTTAAQTTKRRNEESPSDRRPQSSFTTATAPVITRKIQPQHPYVEYYYEETKKCKKSVKGQKLISMFQEISKTKDIQNADLRP